MRDSYDWWAGIEEHMNETGFCSVGQIHLAENQDQRQAGFCEQSTEPQVP